MFKFHKIIILLGISVPFFGTGSAYAYDLPEIGGVDIKPSGSPYYENNVEIKYQRSDQQKYKLTAEAKKIDGTYYIFDDSYAVTDLSYKLRADFDYASQTFLDGTIRINGVIDDFGASGVLFTATLDEFATDGDLIGFNTTVTSCNDVLDCIVGSHESVYLAEFGGGFSLDLKKFRADGIAITTVPVPAAVWLFGSGLLGLASFARKRKETA